MKLYVDLNGDQHYLVTEDGEAVYVDDLEDEGRDTEYLEQAISVAKRRRVAKSFRTVGSLDVETFNAESDS